MKKYLYAGILLGTVVLAACSANKEIEGQVSQKGTEDLTDGQTVAIKSLSNATDKEKAKSKTPLKLTQEQKEDYHKQYAKIIERVNTEYPDANLELVSLNEFKEEDWVEPEEFRQIAIDRTKLEFVVEKRAIIEH